MSYFLKRVVTQLRGYSFLGWALEVIAVIAEGDDHLKDFRT
jgi:hypothetical protein